MILIFNIFCQVIDLINIISKPYYGKKFKSKYTKKEEKKIGNNLSFKIKILYFFILKCFNYFKLFLIPVPV